MVGKTESLPYSVVGSWYSRNWWLLRYAQWLAKVSSMQRWLYVHQFLLMPNTLKDPRKVRFPTRPDLANNTLPSCPASFSMDASKVWEGAWPWATRDRISREYEKRDASCCTINLLKSCRAIIVGGLENVRTLRNPVVLTGQIFRMCDDLEPTRISSKSDEYAGGARSCKKSFPTACCIDMRQRTYDEGIKTYKMGQHWSPFQRTGLQNCNSPELPSFEKIHHLGTEARTTDDCISF